MNPIEALAWYYREDCEAVAMGILESVFDRPAADVLGISTEQAKKDVKKFVKPIDDVEDWEDN